MVLWLQEQAGDGAACFRRLATRCGHGRASSRTSDLLLIDTPACASHRHAGRPSLVSSRIARPSLDAALSRHWARMRKAARLGSCGQLVRCRSVGAGAVGGAAMSWVHGCGCSSVLRRRLPPCGEAVSVRRWMVGAARADACAMRFGERYDFEIKL
jgi:hypothetical protein